MRRIALFLICLFAAEPALAQRSPYGVWFAYGDKRDIVAMTVKGRVGLSIFCASGDLTLGVVDKQMDRLALRPGESLNVRFRADDGSEIATTATARNARSLAFSESRTMIRRITGAQRVSFQFTRADGSRFSRDYVVTGARAVMDDIMKTCPL